LRQNPFPRIFSFLIPDPPVQSPDLRDDHSLRRNAREIADRHRAGVGENAPKSRTTIGEGRQRGVAGSAGGVEAPADQRLDVRVGFRDGAENLSATGLRFDIANPPR
jgi:hypothetical protein